MSAGELAGTVPERRGLLTWVATDPLRAVLAAIAAVTVLSGASQIPFGDAVLRLLGADPSALARQLFGTVGMFMVVIGGLLLQTMVSSSAAPRTVLLWCGAQKAGAAAAVALGVVNSVFSPLALAVASFDFLSAVLCFVYWRRLQR